MATDFTPLASLLGGMLIGLAAVGLMATLGRIAGMTGIVAGLLPPWDKVEGWRAAFVAGAVIAPAAVLAATGTAPTFSIPPGLTLPLMIASGFIVGIGVTFGSGCTSGHGVCGLARLSPRSLAAVLTFMLTAGITVYIVRHVIGIAG